jgi:hypothetical protein
MDDLNILLSHALVCHDPYTGINSRHPSLTPAFTQEPSFSHTLPSSFLPALHIRLPCLLCHKKPIDIFVEWIVKATNFISFFTFIFARITLLTNLFLFIFSS